MLGMEGKVSLKYQKFIRKELYQLGKVPAKFSYAEEETHIPHGLRSGNSKTLCRKSRHSRESGNPSRSGDADPRPSASSGQALRGGDEGLNSVSMGGPQGHDNSQ
jgi:hypothetical protein